MKPNLIQLLNTFETKPLSEQDTFHHLNKVINDITDSARFVTLFYGKLHLPENQFEFINDGHNPPLWFKQKTKTIQWVDATGMPIGLFPESQYEAETIQLGAEDILVFYTDGLSEAENPAGEQFFKERIAEIARRCTAADGSQEIYDRLLGSVTEFRDGKHFDDDLTLIVLKL